MKRSFGLTDHLHVWTCNYLIISFHNEVTECVGIFVFARYILLLSSCLCRGARSEHIFFLVYAFIISSLKPLAWSMDSLFLAYAEIYLKHSLFHAYAETYLKHTLFHAYPGDMSEIYISPCIHRWQVRNIHYFMHISATCPKHTLVHEYICDMSEAYTISCIYRRHVRSIIMFGLCRRHVSQMVILREEMSLLGTV